MHRRGGVAVRCRQSSGVEFIENSFIWSLILQSISNMKTEYDDTLSYLVHFKHLHLCLDGVKIEISVHTPIVEFLFNPWAGRHITKSSSVRSISPMQRSYRGSKAQYVTRISRMSLRSKAAIPKNSNSTLVRKKLRWYRAIDIAHLIVQSISHIKAYASHVCRHMISLMSWRSENRNIGAHTD